jgi:excinuclease ABC subunit A
LAAAWPPETIVAEPRSHTGQFLKELLGRRPGRKKEAAE